MNIIEARRDPRLFGHMYRDPATWTAWDAVLKGIYALPMDAAENRIFRKLTQRKPPVRPVSEAWIIAGRRGGKTWTAAEIAVYGAAFRDYRPSLQPGETAVIMLLAVDRGQAKVALRYISAFFRGIPMLAKLVRRETADGIELSNGAAIQVATNNFRRVRGRTVACAIFDETAFWRDSESANPDQETYRAIIPALATVDGALLVGISSPYRRAGLLYEKYSEHYGKTGDVLVVQAASRDLNPTLPKRVVDDALRRDAAAARAEWLAEFREDIKGYLDPATVDGAVAAGMKAMAPREGVTYRAFCDPAGTGKDEFTVAIGHLEGKRRIVDLVLGRQGKPHGIVAEYAGTLKEYGIHVVTGDKYAAGWVRDAFAAEGVRYAYADKNRSEIYLETAPLFTTGLVTIPDDRRLTTQLKSLERRTTRSGRDQIDHPPSGHDDRANAVCGLLQRLSVSSAGPRVW